MIEQYAGFRIILGAIILLIATAIMLCILVVVFRRREISPTLRFLFVAVIVLDALLPSYDFNPITPTKYIVPPTPPVLQDMILQTGDGRMMGLDLLLDPNISMHYGFRDIRGYDLPHNLRLVRLFKRLGIDTNDNHGSFSINSFYPYIHSDVAAYLNRACVRSVMMFIPDPNAAKVLTSLKLVNDFQSPGHMNWPQTAAPGNGVLVFSNPNSYPRTFLARTADSISDPQAAMDVLLDDKSDLRDRSVYEGAEAPYPAAQSADTSADTAVITQDQDRPDKPAQIVIDVNTASQRMLVLEDRMDDGWEVRIDGKSAEALTANYLFRGVFVPAGHHTVEWTYHAPGLAAGVTLSALSLLGVVGILIVAAFRRKPLESDPLVPVPSGS